MDQPIDPQRVALLEEAAGIERWLMRQFHEDGPGLVMDGPDWDQKNRRYREIFRALFPEDAHLWAEPSDEDG